MFTRAEWYLKNLVPGSSLADFKTDWPALRTQARKSGRNTHLQTHALTHARTHAHTSTHPPTCPPTHTCTHTHACTDTYRHTHITHTRTYINTLIYTYTMEKALSYERTNTQEHVCTCVWDALPALLCLWLLGGISLQGEYLAPCSRCQFKVWKVVRRRDER